MAVLLSARPKNLRKREAFLIDRLSWQNKPPDRESSYWLLGPSFPASDALGESRPRAVGLRMCEKYGTAGRPREQARFPLNSISRAKCLPPRAPFPALYRECFARSFALRHSILLENARAEYCYYIFVMPQALKFPMCYLLGYSL